MARKTEFELEVSHGFHTAQVLIRTPGPKPYLYFMVTTANNSAYSAKMEGRDLERFAVNILKALNSKKLKQLRLKP